MPMSQAFNDRLFPRLKEIAAHFGTPFHIYDEIGIRETCQALTDAFSDVRSFREYFAVKALPNPRPPSPANGLRRQRPRAFLREPLSWTSEN